VPKANVANNLDFELIPDPDVQKVIDQSTLNGHRILK